MEEAWALSEDLQQSGQTYHQDKDCTFHFSFFCSFVDATVGFHVYTISVYAASGAKMYIPLCLATENFGVKTCNLFNKMIVICKKFALSHRTRLTAADSGAPRTSCMLLCNLREIRTRRL